MSGLRAALEKILEQARTPGGFSPDKRAAGG
jgi:hypothetical protein